ncbi:MAG TPA: response regulator [Patescibacteria group bacterium]
MSKILILDDDRDFLEGVRVVLEDAGYSYIATADNRTIQQKIRSYHPDLVILDIFLNEDNGKNIAKELKFAKDTKKIPILMVSGSSRIEDYSSQAKAEAYLQKPFSGNDLVKAITQLI